MRKEKIVWGRNLPDIDFGIEKSSYGEMMDSYKFPVPSFKDVLLFMYKAAPQKVEKAFLENAGIHISSKNNMLEWIVNTQSSGNDKRICKVDFKNVVNAIVLTQNEISSACAEIKFGY